MSGERSGGPSGRWDAIVVGAGTAGIPCAIEAAARGAFEAWAPQNVNRALIYLITGE